MNIIKRLWGSYEGRDVWIVKLQNENMEVAISNFGAAIVALSVPDKNGHSSNIVLGYETLQEYIDDEFYTGCVVGRFAGRIADAAFTINGVDYSLTPNEGDNIHLHGGSRGFGKQVFSVTREKITSSTALVELYYRSGHLEEGYPGNLDLWIQYELSAVNQLSIRYRAVTDSDTHINLTNHSYFNLGNKDQSILEHCLSIDADRYLVVNKNHLPTGAVEPVDSTAYSFKQLRRIADGMRALHGAGYNDCYILNDRPGQPKAVLQEAVSGRSITLETDMPALLFYTGDYLSGKFIKNNGLCLETQFFPDAPNQPGFTGTLLKAGAEWNSCTRLGFHWNV